MKGHLSVGVIAVAVAAIIGGCSGGSSDSDSSVASKGTTPGSGASSSGGASAASAASMSAVDARLRPRRMDVTTYHNDVGRTGQQLAETALSPANVNPDTFGKLGFYGVDGVVDAQPLFLGNLQVAGARHNVLYVATENASVYAFDADTGDVLWQVSTVLPGETPSDDHGCNQTTPTIGITSTPVIDRSRGAIYLVAMSKDSGGAYHQRIHALDITSGAELFGGPTEITASYPGTGSGSVNGVVPFTPGQYIERASLLLLNGVVYTAWSSHCDTLPYTGWVIGYNADTLQQTGVLNVTPNGEMGGIWMSGGGLASDGTSIYFLDGNGTFDPTTNAQNMPIHNDFGNGFLKVTPTPTLQVTDYFQPSDTVVQSSQDLDLGSGGVVVLPDVTDVNGNVRHLAVGGGKTRALYIVDRDNMGTFDSASDHIYQELFSTISGPMFTTPAFYNNTVYVGPAGDHLKALPVVNGLLATAASYTSTSPPWNWSFPGFAPVISANGDTNGIVWGVENVTPAVLHAYDASDLFELYSSNTMGSRDQFGPGAKFISPTIANGKVYVGTKTGVAVFGLLGS
ncbi:Outer membrane protein assembly factor BamB [Caballeronia hypogeia]|uniref:Outer membrane protein assembly factor BamB n=1 Tax=Caballeronia hypogeia TaxID=1777140 RepID=A0A157ZJ41_9BURK|nr:PQQ-binding-like beta-propeller repeat protein [Caballeronia hypogeia]SAK45505.1 Outer membrane protein assembly factor BamB [Caballeronia hypogeia]